MKKHLTFIIFVVLLSLNIGNTLMKNDLVQLQRPDV